MTACIKPTPGGTIWVVRSRCGRDRKRVFLAFRCPEVGENPAEHGAFPVVYTINGGLHPVECPKKKHLAHVSIVGTLEEPEVAWLFSDYSNKTVAEIVRKYDEYGENLKKRENSEIGS